MIFGIYLSDRVYVSGDTRVTFKDAKGSVSYEDNVMKVSSIGLNTVVAVAGNLSFAKFFMKPLYKQADGKDVVKIRESIEEWSRSIADSYFRKNPYTTICMIIGGMDASRKHKIDGKKLIPLVKEFQEIREVPMRLKDNLFKAISAHPDLSNPYPELPNDTPVLFSVVVGPPNRGIVLEDATWGEYLAYGPGGINKDTITKEIFGRFEFEVGSGDYVSDSVTAAALINIESEDRHLTTVGGSITTFVVDDAVKTVTSSIKRFNASTETVDVISETKLENNKFYSKIGGIWVELIPIVDYSKKSSDLQI